MGLATLRFVSPHVILRSTKTGACRLGTTGAWKHTYLGGNMLKNLLVLSGLTAWIAIGLATLVTKLDVVVWRLCQ